MNRTGSGLRIPSYPRIVLCLLLCLMTRQIMAQTPLDVTSQGKLANPSPTSVPAGRKSIGLALEGGGALGLAHVGVLKWMQAHHVPVDVLAGTSMGALVGSLLASGYSPAEIEHIASSGDFDEMFTLKPSLSKVSFRRREDRDSLPQALTFGSAQR